MKERTITVRGTNTLGLLGLVFVALKLCNVVNWSWWIVTLPFWGGLALAVVIFIVAFVVGLLLGE